jgi:hypothetical protein
VAIPDIQLRRNPQKHIIYRVLLRARDSSASTQAEPSYPDCEAKPGVNSIFEEKPAIEIPHQDRQFMPATPITVLPLWEVIYRMVGLVETRRR